MSDTTEINEQYTSKAERVLPCCGLALRHMVGEFAQPSPYAPPTPEGWEERNRARLEYWLNERTSRHRCELVSADNPMGLMPRPRK
jgi:hypothetical protein